jgi:hypothetical protein
VCCKKVQENATSFCEARILSEASMYSDSDSDSDSASALNQLLMRIYSYNMIINLTQALENIFYDDTLKTIYLRMYSGWYRNNIAEPEGKAVKKEDFLVNALL